MRKILLLILGLLVIPLEILVAQAPKIIAYQYWFDDNDAGMISQSVSPASTLDLTTSLNMPMFPVGFHRFNIRFKDDSLRYSQVSSSMFFFPVSPLINGYEYWFNNDYAGKTVVSVSNTTLLDLSSAISSSALNPGMNTFHIRFRDVSGIYSATTSAYFVILPEMLISSYEYWFDDNPTGKVSVPLVNQPTTDVVAMINAATLQPGLHKAHVRFQSGDLSSIVSSSYFYKSGTANISENAVSGYRFWFNNDPATMRVIALAQPGSNVILLDSVELPYLPLGKHLMNVEFRDTLGIYSSIVSDSVDVLTCTPYEAKAITGSTQVCKGTNGVVYSIPRITNATGYSWILPSGATIVSGANTRTITVNFLLNAISGAISVHGTNPCGNGTAYTLNVTVNPLPNALITPNGPTNLCQGESVVLAASGGTGYVWSNASTTTVITVNTSGNYTVTVTNNFGCIKTASQVVTVNPLPTPVITPGGPTTFCQGGSVVLTASGGTGYLWSNAATTAAITVNTNGNYTVTVTNASGCKNTASQEVSVKPLPPSTRILTGTVVPGGQTLCADATDTLIVPGGGNNFLVQNGGSAILIAGKTIRLLQGAMVVPGGYLHGYLSEDCFYCNAVPHTLPQALKEQEESGISGSGIPGTDNSNFFRVYPNPTSGSFILELNSQDHFPGAVQIYGMHGELLISEQLPMERKHEFSLKDKPKGIYIIRVISEGVSGTARIIKY